MNCLHSAGPICWVHRWLLEDGLQALEASGDLSPGRPPTHARPRRSWQQAPAHAVGDGAGRVAAAAQAIYLHMQRLRCLGRVKSTSRAAHYRCSCGLRAFQLPFLLIPDGPQFQHVPPLPTQRRRHAPTHPAPTTNKNEKHTRSGCAHNFFSAVMAGRVEREGVTFCPASAAVTGSDARKP